MTKFGERLSRILQRPLKQYRLAVCREERIGSSDEVEVALVVGSIDKGR